MARTYLGTGYTFDSLLSVADTASDLTSLSITNTGANGVSIDLTGNGSTTPSKFLRVTSGQFQIINSAYTSVILAVTDLGVLSAGGITSTPISGSTGSFTTLAASGAAAFTSTLNVTGFTTLGSGNIGPGGSYFGSNTIYNSGWKYVGTDFAWFMRSDGTTSDVVSLNVAPSGTAGAAMTFVQAFSVSQTGLMTIPIGLTVNGVSTLTGSAAFGTGITFGAQIGASNTDLSKHISLWGGNFGFCITGASLNYTVPPGSAHYFNINGTNALTVAGGAVTVTGSLACGNQSASGATGAFTVWGDHITTNGDVGYINIANYDGNSGASTPRVIGQFKVGRSGNNYGGAVTISTARQADGNLIAALSIDDSQNATFANGLSASGTVSGAGITSLLAPYALLAGATFSGNISAPSIFTSGASIGLVGLYTGGASNTGYVAFYDPSGTRQGYIGYAPASGYLSLESENGNLGYNVTGQLVVNGLTTLASGLSVPGTIAATTIGASGFITSGFLMASGQWNTSTATSQGAYIGWNYTGGGGETDFINNKGGGAGGFSWYNTSSAAALTQLATLNSLGAFSTVSVVGLGNGGGTASAFLAQKSGSVGYGWDDTSQGTDAKVWDALAVSGTMLFRASNDTNGAATTWLSVTRSGYAPQVITLTAPTITLAGNASVTGMLYRGNSTFVASSWTLSTTTRNPTLGIWQDTNWGLELRYGPNSVYQSALFAYTGGEISFGQYSLNATLQSQYTQFAYFSTSGALTVATPTTLSSTLSVAGATTLSGPVTASGGVSSGTFNLTAGQYRWTTSGQGTDQNIWDSYNSGLSSLMFRAVNDAYSAANNWLSVTRSGYAPQVITLTAPTITLAGNASVTGSLTLTGVINIGGAGNYYSSNLTYSGGWKYIASDYGAMLYFGGSAGTSLYVAPTGTAGGTAAIVQAWNVTPAGAMTVYGPLTCAGTISAGTATFTGGLFVSGGTWAPGMLYSDGNWGMLIRGQTRTVDADLALCNGAGNVSLGIMASGLTTINTGLSFNSQVGANNTDCSKHIALWGTTFGFNVTASALNYTVSTGSAHYFNINGTNALTVANGSTTVTGNLTVTGTISGVTGSTTSVSTIAALRLLASGANAVYVQGYSAAGDGGGGFFNLGASGTDNAATIIVSANGTYYRDIGTGPISLLAFGATGNGTTDDAAAFNRVTTILTHGGAVTLPAGHAFTVLSAVTIGAGISICGPYENAGEFALSHTGSPAWLPSSAYTASQTAVNNSNIYRVTTAGTSASSGGPSGTGTGITDGTVVWSYVQPQASFWTTYCTLTISSAVTVTLDSSTTITGCLIYRAGMTFPITTAAAFAGNAFTFNGDNVCIRNSIIMGFQYAIASTGCDRGVIENVCFDNLKNIYASGAGDTWRIHFCHAWPFAADATAMASLTRAGSNIFISNCNDAAIVRDCFEYGYLNGFVANNAGAVSFIRCGADGTSPPYSGSSGFLIQGSATSTTGALNAQVVDCQAYLQTAAVNVPLGGTVMSTVKITGCTMGGCTDGIYIPASSASLVQVYNNDIGAGTGIVYSAATVLMDIDNNNFSGCGTIINATVATENIHIGQGNRGGYIGGTTDGLSLAPGSNLVLFTITPAGSIAALPPVGDVFGVAAGNFGTLAGGHTGRRVTLLFLGASAVYSSSGSSAMFLNGNVTFNAIAYSTLTLVYTGSQWFEVSRMVA